MLGCNDYVMMQSLILLLGSSSAGEEYPKSLGCEENSKGFSPGGIQVAVSCYQAAKRQPKTQRLAVESKTEK